MSKTCDFCNELNLLTNFKSVKHFFKDSRIFASNETLCMFPTLGCFKVGYILLVTIKHYISLYKCPKDIVNKVSDVVDQMKFEFKQRMDKKMIFFEHGTINDITLSSASVSHFHLHFIPFDFPIWKKINKKYNFNYFILNSLLDIYDIVEKNNIKAYILFGDVDNTIYLINCTNKSYPSQFFRKVIYEECFENADSNEWDWKLYPFYENIEKTIEIFQGVRI